MCRRVAPPGDGNGRGPVGLIGSTERCTLADGCTDGSALKQQGWVAQDDAGTIILTTPRKARDPPSATRRHMTWLGRAGCHPNPKRSRSVDVQGLSGKNSMPY